MLLVALFASAISKCDTYEKQAFNERLIIKSATDKCVIVTACQFVNIESKEQGAGIYLYTMNRDLTLTVQDSLFADSKSFVSGGGIYFVGYNCTLLRNCVSNLHATYNGAWASISMPINTVEPLADVQDCTMVKCISEMNMISFSNGNVSMTRTNFTGCKATIENIAATYTSCMAMRTSYVTAFQNTGRGMSSNVFFCSSTHIDPIMYFDHLNIIGNSQPHNGGAIFSLQIGTRVSNLVALENNRDLVTVIRFKAYFIDCWWDSTQDVWQLVETENVHTKTVTSTYDMQLSQGCEYTAEAQKPKPFHMLEKMMFFGPKE